MTHAVANTIKRVAVIVISVLYFRNPLTASGVGGSTIAIIGVLLLAREGAVGRASGAQEREASVMFPGHSGNRTQSHSLGHRGTFKLRRVPRRS